MNKENGRMLHYIAKIHTDFPEKFGIPRQAGLAGTKGTIIFEPEYRKEEALRGLEEYSHLWLIWEFSEAVRDNWSPTVRPPRLGGNTRKGVFATRSPFRPNPVGLSCVKLTGIEKDLESGMVLHVEGADLLDGTPIFDIKPYLPYADEVKDAKGGFADRVKDYALEVVIPESLLEKLPKNQRKSIREILAEDPRPSYQKDPERMYGMSYAGYEIHFQVKDQILTVCGIEKQKNRRNCR